MVEKFHNRFDLEVGLDDARRRFVNRAQNLLFGDLHYRSNVCRMSGFTRKTICG